MIDQTSHASSVNAFYLAFYGRPADPAGLRYWEAQLDANGGDLGAIAGAFAASEEAQVRFGGDTLSSRITQIYEQLFNRTPDADGLAYWSGMVESGDVALANVALDILKGAREVDLDLSNKRLQAVEAFTARVEAGGSAYEGTPAIDAARVLVRAVTADATDADIGTLVAAAVSFADTATKTPAVIEAIASGTTLLALFDSTRGQADPVALAQTLADTAKAAAGNPATLESLLRGGGMAEVLKAMPAGATLKDVVDALAKGGLAAAIDVVYPPVAVPAPGISDLAFKNVSEGSADPHADHVTNIPTADVAFSYKGADLRGGQVFEYSIDGETWVRTGIEVDTRTNTVVIKEVDLTDGTPTGGESASMPLPRIAAAPEPDIDMATTVRLRAVAANGTTVVEASQQIVYDGYVATPRVVLVNDTFSGLFGSDGDRISKEGAFTLSRVEEGAIVEYLMGDAWSGAAPALHEGANTFSVRQTDKAGNVSEPREVTIVVDTQAPSAPAIALNADSGNDTDRITNDGRIALSGLEENLDGGWEYTTDGGETWQFGAFNNGTGSAELDLTSLGDGTKHVKVRQVDAAGNIGAGSGAEEFTLDATGPNGTLGFDTVEGTIRSGVTTLAAADVQFSYSGTVASDETIAYRLDGGSWTTLDASAWNAATHKLTIADVDLSTADRTVEVRIADVAGNVKSASQLVDSLFNNVPERSTVSGFVASFSGNPGIVTFYTGPQTIIPDTRPGNEQGLANKDTFLFESMRSGTAAPTSENYLDGELFHVYERMVRVDATPSLDFYRISWSDDTFLTNGDSGKGYVAAGSVMFVGGRTGLVSVQGFNIAEIVTPGASHASLDTEARNTAFIDNGQGASHIVTGGGMDLVVDHGGTLTLGYGTFATAAQDVIFGFDTGNDAIEIDGDAAALVDRDGNGAIAWQHVTANATKAVISAGTEAVQLTTSGWLLNSTSAHDIGLTLATLNNPLDVSGVQQGDGLLILVSSVDRGGLFYYTNSDGNGVIDSAELTYVNLFVEGIVNGTDIDLVGIPA